jgi:hypothetical protein
MALESVTMVKGFRPSSDCQLFPRIVESHTHRQYKQASKWIFDSGDGDGGMEVDFGGVSNLFVRLGVNSCFKTLIELDSTVRIQTGLSRFFP